MMGPVRGVGQALDPVEIGHVVMIRLGQFRPELTVALAPNYHNGPELSKLGADVATVALRQ